MDNKDRIYNKHMKLRNCALPSSSEQIKLKHVFADNSETAEKARKIFATPPYYKLISFKRPTKE